MKTVKDVIADKGRQFPAVTPEHSVLEAIRIMAEKNVGALVVIEGGKIAGMISERDYTRKVVLHGKSSKDTPVREIMSTTVITTTPDQPVDRCMARMTEHKIRHMPVVEGGKLLGVVSILDVAEALVTDQEFTIRQLEGYISGEPA